MQADDSVIPSVSRPRMQRRTLWMIQLSLAVVFAGTAYWCLQPAADTSERDDFLQRFKGGALVIGGGGTLPPEVRQRFVDLIGGQDARLVVIPAYEAEPDQITRITDYWRGFGVRDVRILQARNRAESDQPAFAEPLEHATGVWLTGGDQAWYADLYVGTQVEQKLKDLLERGGSIGGTSAGAAIMSQVMIRHSLEGATVATGFDLFPNAVIDQHFMHRSRLNRLLGVLTKHPEHMGFGIDEDTALIVQLRTGKLGVMGRSYVLAYVPKTEAGNPRYEFLKAGDTIDLDSLHTDDIRVSSPQELDDILD